MITLIFATLGLSALAFIAVWLISLWMKDASIIDIYWGPSFAVLAAAALYLSPHPIAFGHSALVAICASVWAVRLGLYLAIRNLGHGEDARYVAMRAKHPENFAMWSLVWVFGLQWGVSSLVGLPVIITILAAPSGPIGALSAVGLALWLIGFLFEAVGDAQLRAFKQDRANQGVIMDKGLWGLTRHPNYFGNACLWWGIGLIAVEAGHWWTLLGPVVMTYFLLNVSGKALLERRMSRANPAYEAYVARTSGFFPLPPKRGK